ncbi:aspartate aminotransferase family protein [Roseovarius sp. SCSIO 43702]|uniref:aspartate aminotransferase family protein n=1 Tax=Roseovarius sp. SCSIO 43702 TaxID=2823043 RepID=UPI001C7360E0|nr:aspartate aminotransferase family protein [Roseovarius sp. SCSIO 43702]QYX56417.1 aspartate aminotransferase family protein [Roseovarius sp. SCSIO 43702]
MTMVNAFDAGKGVTLDPEDAALIERRARAMGPAYRLFYEEPLHIVRGEGVWLWDSAGRRFLDGYNNVASLGHCHPKVIEAIARQAGILNTHTRYLHGDVVAYAERLLATMPDGLGHVMFTCTGSEANDLALRIARSHTGRDGVIVTRNAYHGVTEAVAELSPSLGPHVPRGARVRVIDAPDPVNVPPEEQGAKMARDLAQAISGMRADGIEPAAFLCDTLFSSDGLYPDPAGFLSQAVEVIRAEGGLFIADEVQAGFARSGEAWWGVARHGVAPDMITMGKPMGNGFPVAGVALRPEVVAEFGAKARYFNTFGGNPVAVAAGMAVMDVIEGEGLMDNSRRIGGMLKEAIGRICEGRDDTVAVRGAGLYLALDCVAGGAPDAEMAAFVVNHMRRNGVLISATGPKGHCLKIRPPLVMGEDEAELLAGALDAALGAWRR